MDEQDIKDLATVIANSSNMGVELNGLKEEVKKVVSSTTVISTQLGDFFIRDEKHKKEILKRSDDHEKRLTSTETNIKWIKRLGISGALAALTKLVY